MKRNYLVYIILALVSFLLLGSIGKGQNYAIAFLIFGSLFAGYHIITMTPEQRRRIREKRAEKEAERKHYDRIKKEAEIQGYGFRMGHEKAKQEMEYKSNLRSNIRKNQLSDTIFEDPFSSKRK